MIVFVPFFDGCLLCGRISRTRRRRWSIRTIYRLLPAIRDLRRPTGLNNRGRDAIQPSLQTLDLLQQCLLLLVHLAKQFSNNGVLGLQGIDVALQVVRWRFFGSDVVHRAAWFRF